MRASLRPTARGVLAAAVLAALLVSGGGAAAESIVGVCPDGSMFIVRRPQDVPCAGAKQVEPSDVPPIRPHYLPRPYAWEVFRAQQDPNNPYNLVDKARAVRESGVAPEEAPAPRVDPQQAQPAPRPRVDSQQAQPAPSPRVASTAPPRPALPEPRRLDLALSEEEARDLALIVELSQERAPATLSREEGEAEVVLRLAHSRAFEARLHAAAAAAGLPLNGAVVLFSAEADGPARFYANLTFAQSHTAFHPEREDPAQFGLVEGRLGELAAGDRVLGYVVLPAEVDPGQPLDVYWNDRRLVTTLRP